MLNIRAFSKPIKNIQKWFGSKKATKRNSSKNADSQKRIESSSQTAKHEHSEVEKESSEKIMAKAALENQSEDQMPDVLIDLPKLTVNEIKLDTENLNAKVEVHANLANFVDININVQVAIEKLNLDLKGLDAEAIVKVRLKQIRAIITRALETIDKNPGVLKDILKSDGSIDSQISNSFKVNNSDLDTTIRTFSNVNEKEKRKMTKIKKENL